MDFKFVLEAVWIFLPMSVANQMPGLTAKFNLPYNNLSVTMSYSTNENIKEGKTFNMYGLDYKIIGIDYSKVLNNVGIIQLLADRVI